MKKEPIDIFSLAEENEEIKPTHIAIYTFLRSMCQYNDEYHLDVKLIMACTGIKAYNTYKRAANELEKFGLIKIKKVACNQFSGTTIIVNKIGN